MMLVPNNEERPQAEEPAGVKSTTVDDVRKNYGATAQASPHSVSENASSDGTKKNRYRKVEFRTWADEKFMALSPMPASGQSLWLYLMTGPHTSRIPGLFRAGRAGMAEELGWELEAFDEVFREVSEKGMAKADFKARLVWLPNALKHNKPESPNVVVSWRSELDVLPECDLKREATSCIHAFIESIGPSYLIAFDEEKAPKKDDKKASDKGSPKAMANQEQEQEQEQNQEQKNSIVADAPAATKKRATAKTPLPDNFGITDRVRLWAAEKGHDRLDEHMESFRSKAAAKGYVNLNWDEAFMRAVRENWAKLTPTAPASRAQQPGGGRREL